MDAGVLLLRLVLVQIVALAERSSEDQQVKTATATGWSGTARGLTLTEQLFFLLAPMGDSFIRIGAIFLTFAAAFFFSGTRGLLLRFL